MYDLSTKFNEFYRDNVVLPADVQNDLREKRKINIKRLKDGLELYNEEHGTKYKTSENRVQGSISMYTAVQNDGNDYDIDIAIVFDKENLKDLGPLATRNMVANALKLKTKQFNVEPEVKTSCVRIKYSEGYHIDFAIYRRYKKNSYDTEYQYEHAGAEWSIRGIRAIEDWFNDEISEKGKRLRKVIRLSKMFCKSREFWVNMPSGLIQTILCNETLNGDERIDELFYNTMMAIVLRLENDLEVNAPVDNNRLLTTRESDKKKMNNWKSRLMTKLEALNVLFDENCTYSSAVGAWKDFFNHNYWEDLFTESVNETVSICSGITFDNTEEFIDDLYNVDERYDVDIECLVNGIGFRPLSIFQFFNQYSSKYGKFIPHNFSISCKVLSTNAPSYDKVLWKVRNVGVEAEKRNDIRGQIHNRGLKIQEHTRFAGKHYIECYLIKNDICIAISHIDVPIGT